MKKDAFGEENLASPSSLAFLEAILIYWGSPSGAAPMYTKIGVSIRNACMNADRAGGSLRLCNECQFLCPQQNLI